MNRGYLTNHLMNNECSPIEELDVEDVSQMWKNNINGEMCYIPYEDELALTTYCHIFYELKVDPPTEYGYDSDYAIYTSFREKQLPQHHEMKNKESGN